MDEEYAIRKGRKVRIGTHIAYFTGTIIGCDDNGEDLLLDFVVFQFFQYSNILVRTFTVSLSDNSQTSLIILETSRASAISSPSLSVSGQARRLVLSG